MATRSLHDVLQHLRQVAAVQTNCDRPDRELLERFVAARDEAAFTVLIERHGPMVLGVCRRALPNCHDAEDACQASFLVLARKAASIRQQTSLSSWLHGVACRVAANLKRDQARRKTRERGVDAPAPKDPAAEASWREVQTILDEELQRLPERYRAPLILCYLNCLTRDEAARQLGLSLTTLHGRLERARDCMRVCLTKRGLTLGAVLSAAALGDSVAQAALAPTFVVSSTRAAMLLAAGQPLTESVVATHVLALTREVLKSMFLTKLKLGTAAVLCAGLFAVLMGGSFTLPSMAEDANAPRGDHVIISQKSEVDVKPAKARQDEDALQGTWKVVASELGGLKQPTEDFFVTFAGDKIFVKDDGLTKEFRYILNSMREPRHIDWKPAFGEHKGKTIQGIYRLDGDKLVLCTSATVGIDRPIEFTAKHGSRDSLMVLQRQKKRAGAKQEFLAFSADGKTLASMKIWDTTAGKELDLAQQAENDLDFIRRISKDLRGIEPTLAEVHFFVASKDEARRQKLLDLFIQERQAKKAARDLSARIDSFIQKRWADEAKRSAEDAISDADFMRRRWLDLTGQLPSPADLDSFLKSKDPNKRTKLIDRLLESDDFAKLWADYFGIVVAARQTKTGLGTLQRTFYKELFAATNKGDVARITQAYLDRMIDHLRTTPRSQDVPETMRQIIFVYESQGKTVEAGAWRDKLLQEHLKTPAPSQIRGAEQTDPLPKEQPKDQKPRDLAAQMKKLGRLPVELVKARKSDAEIVQALFRASLERVPDDAERTAMTKLLDGAKDRTQKSRDILFLLVHSHEFLKLHNLDGNIPEALRLINELSADWDTK